MPDYAEKSRTAYNKKADGYTDSREGRFTGGFQRLLIPEMKLAENQNVLDVACGNGSLLAAMNRIKPINGFGIDISERMIENAASDNPKMEFHVAMCDSMPFGDGSIDVMTVCAAYHHFPDTAAFAKEAKRVLKQDGRIYIAEIYLSLLLRLIINPFVPLSKDGDVKFYSPKMICQNFECLGFRRESVRITGRVQIVALQKI